MNDLDPKIWENKTLGSATTTPYLDDVAGQIIENRYAKAEGRKPEMVVSPRRFSDETTNLPKYVVDGKVVDPTTATDELAYFHDADLERVEKETESSKSLQEGTETKDKVPVQGSETKSAGKAPTAKAASK